MRRERMSRPNSSVPHQCAEDGRDRRVGKSMWAGSWGAIQGANRAKITKMRTRTTPIVARRLWLAARRNEMAMVDKLKVSRLLAVTCERELPRALFHQAFQSPQRDNLPE